MSRSSLRFEAALHSRLRGKSCCFHGNDLKIEVAGSWRYPDGLVVCRPIDNNATVVTEPVVFFEVLSPSTASKDRIVMSWGYQATPTVQRYFVLEQDRLGATVYSRVGEGWTFDILSDGAVLSMPEIGVEVPSRRALRGPRL